MQRKVAELSNGCNIDQKCLTTLAVVEFRVHRRALNLPLNKLCLFFGSSLLLLPFLPRRAAASAAVSHGRKEKDLLLLLPS